MSGKPKVIIIRETMLEGIVNDVSMASVFIVLIGVGVYLGSTAMQWAGFTLGVLFFIGTAAQAGKDRTMTIAQAQVFLLALEAQQQEPEA